MRPHGSTSRGFLTSVVAMVTIALMGQLVVIVLSLSESRAGAAAGTPLIGTFQLTPGSCSGGGATGTYLRMVLSGGTNSAGPYFSNSDSTCSDNTYTPLAPGTAGGLVTGNYQPEPSPAFDSSGNALSNAITAPVAFEGVRFSTSTNPVDPQTSLHVPAPSVVVNGISLSGNLQSFGVSWNDQQFNQGSPKPDGSAPGNTTPVSGAYNPSTGAFTLQWSSQVVGGPFNGFSAFWNLTGRFVPAAGSAAPAPSGAPGAGSAAGTAAGTHGATGATSAGSGAASAGGTNATGASTTGASSAGSTTATSAPSGSAASAGTGAPKAQTIEATRTASNGGPGWQAPNWLIALVTVLAVTGLSGVFLSERALRRARHAGPAT